MADAIPTMAATDKDDGGGGGSGINGLVAVTPKVVDSVVTACGHVCDHTFTVETAATAISSALTAKPVT